MSRAKHVLSPSTALRINSVEGAPRTKNSKHERGPADRNSKQFQMTKICKIPNNSFGERVFQPAKRLADRNVRAPMSALQFKIYLSLSLFRSAGPLSIFGFRIFLARVQA